MHVCMLPRLHTRLTELKQINSVLTFDLYCLSTKGFQRNVYTEIITIINELNWEFRILKHYLLDHPSCQKTLHTQTHKHTLAHRGIQLDIEFKLLVDKGQVNIIRMAMYGYV